MDGTWKIDYKHRVAVSLGENMDKKKISILGLLAVVAIVIGGIGFARAYYSQESNDRVTCYGNGPVAISEGRGFWSQLTEEQRAELSAHISDMIQNGASIEEIRDSVASILEEWGIEPPQWSGPWGGPHHDYEGCGGFRGYHRYDGQGMRSWGQTG